MENVHAWGLAIIRAIQATESGPLTALMKGVTFLGTEYAFMGLLLYVIWCVDERKGLRLGAVVLISAWLNQSVKDAFLQPRPYNLDPAVGRAYEPTYGFPSAHAQNSLVFWTVVGAWLRRPAGAAVAIAVPLAVSFTRLYLGVHFPTDLLGGWLLGGALLGAYFAFGNRAEAILAAANVRARVLLIAVAAFLMNAAAPGHVNLGGAFFGMGVGYVLMSERFPFSAAGDVRGRRPAFPVLALRCLIGFAGTIAVYAGLKSILPGSDSPWYDLGRFCRYAILGAWGTAGAPWVFLRLNLAASRSTLPPPAAEDDDASNSG